MRDADGVRAMKTLSNGIERAGADVAIDNTQSGKCQTRKAGLRVRSLMRQGRRLR